MTVEPLPIEGGGQALNGRNYWSAELAERFGDEGLRLLTLQIEE